jgi:hypothetical protein
MPLRAPTLAYITHATFYVTAALQYLTIGPLFVCNLLDKLVKYLQPLSFNVELL